MTLKQWFWLKVGRNNWKASMGASYANGFEHGMNYGRTEAYKQINARLDAVFGETIDFTRSPSKVIK